MIRIRLTGDEVSAVEAIADELAQRYDTVEAPAFQRESRTYAQELPRRLRAELNEFRLTEKSGTFVVSGLRVEDTALGATPAERRSKPAPSPSLRQDIAFFLIGSVLGDPIGWATQQDGLIMHDVYPVQSHENDQIGWGSAETLSWHTEDAFHPLRTDYLGLMCLRNPDGVETTVADIADVELDEETRAALSEPRFRILPDDAHRGGTRSAGAEDREERLRRLALDRVERALEQPDPLAVLFGDPDDPYLVIDPYYMQGVHGEEQQRALDAAGAAIDRALTGVVLEPGDIVFLDNYRVVHGRKPFRARYDGTDRWLRRLNIARDLRKSREYRLSADSRVIY
ncbi:guanitoxin biosynthesis L-enduracididine beta-hydroxylase GntD [Streptomyces sp. NRRL S-350]|uniref:guanitoxin biosynthesis L-enduracididine beta-hydroxylase GntD n=1 Tax=Streptomyces sp. NRRL S-350 TaxID=1463902 RepID=UPI0004C25510|nr:guanitoxin biosynthesis L-enduracididine beta-hydroxylase GntD [Streptomyces sp. NRRL S-350]